jgi:hypothetical protein
MSFELGHLEQNEEFLRALPNGIWLMDNHKWALSVWAHQHKGVRRCLFHADHHWDAVDLFYGDELAQTQLLAADIQTLDEWILEENRIQYDAFIAPAVRMGLFEQVHFLCTQKDDTDKGLDSALCAAADVFQRLHDGIDSFAAVTPKAPIVFDLCLDLFNESTTYYGSELWSDDQIISTVTSFEHHVRAAELVTVSLSFGYSGTKNDTRRLAALIVPRLIAIRARTISPQTGV